MPSIFEHSPQEGPKRLEEKKPMRAAVKVAVCVAAAIVILFAGGASWALYSYDNVYPGVRAGTVDVSRMDRKALIDELNKVNDQLYKGKRVEFTIQNTKYSVSAEEVHANIDAEKAADVIYAYGRQGNYIKRISNVLKAYITGASVDILSLDKQALEKKSVEIVNAFIKESQSKEYEVKNDKLILYLANKNAVLSKDEVYNAILKRFESADFSKFNIEPDYKKVQEPDLEAICKALQSEPQNAKLDLKKDPRGQTIFPHKDGIEIDLNEAKQILNNRGNAATVEIPVKVKKPEITTEKLQESLFCDVLADVTTNLNPSLHSRTSNVKLAASHINGKILNPGDEFSYNLMVGERTPQRGFKEAKVFENGEIVDGLGGGICQVSSTVYMAVLRADLKILERRSHQFTVSYTPLGQDATVVYGSTDFRFVNSTKYPIRVVAYQKGSGITVQLYGTKTENKQIKLVTNVLEKTPYETRTIVDQSLKDGKKIVESEGHTGYKTVTYRIVYINGKEVRRELVNKSTYKKLDFVKRIGQSAKPANATGGEEQTVNQPAQNDVVLPEADPILGPDQNTTDQNTTEQNTPG
ncbi:MAG: VanW family protein [Clostridiales bacterium]|nr:VanW family protein [Clostridiales bacterium]